MATLLSGMIEPDHPAYYVVDGRHRLVAALHHGTVRTLRCDVLTKAGDVGLRVLDLDELILDPEVQFDYAYDDKRARWLLSHWDHQLCSPLIVVPIADRMSVARRAQIKLGIDRDRRRPSALEIFEAEVKIGDPTACEIKRIVTDVGWEIGKLGSNRSGNKIEAVACLRRIHKLTGPEGLRKTMVLSTKWLGEPKGNSADWLDGLAVFCNEGWDQLLRPSNHAKLEQAIPAKIVRRAIGLNEQVQGGAQRQFSSVGKIVGELIRKQSGVRKQAA